MSEGIGRNSVLDAHDLCTLCIKNRHNSVMDITAVGQVDFQKSPCCPKMQVKAL